MTRIRWVQSYTARSHKLDGSRGCRVVIYAARLAIHPPTTANGINPSCPISPERFHLPLPLPFSSFFLFLCLSLFHRSLPSHFLLIVPLLSSISPLTPHSLIQPRSTSSRPYISPTRVSVSIVPRSWWCQPRAPKRV